MPSKLETLDGRLNSVTVEAVGDTFTYSADGVVAPVTLLGVAEYDEDQFQTGQAAAIAQAILLEINMSDVAARPTDAARITLPAAVPGIIFKPVNVRRSESGSYWMMGLKEVKQ